MSRGPLRAVETIAFSKHLENLPEPVRVVVWVAIESILLDQGMDLANGNWLKYVGDGVWEFRIERTSKRFIPKLGFSKVRKPQTFLY
jgi:hypothetical protein